MRTSEEHRRENMEILAKGYASLAAFARATDNSHQSLLHIRHGNKAMGAVIARRIESMLKLEKGFMDNPQELSEHARNVGEAIDRLTLPSPIKKRIATALVSQIPNLIALLAEEQPQSPATEPPSADGLMPFKPHSPDHTVKYEKVVDIRKRTTKAAGARSFLGDINMTKKPPPKRSPPDGAGKRKK